MYVFKRVESLWYLNSEMIPTMPALSISIGFGGELPICGCTELVTADILLGISAWFLLRQM